MPFSALNADLRNQLKLIRYLTPACISINITLKMPLNAFAYPFKLRLYPCCLYLTLFVQFIPWKPSALICSSSSTVLQQLFLSSSVTQSVKIHTFIKARVLLQQRIHFAVVQRSHIKVTKTYSKLKYIRIEDWAKINENYKKKKIVKKKLLKYL